MLVKNTCVDLEITELNNLGYGVGRYEGQVVFVSGAVDGDTVRARIIRVTASFAVGRVEEVLIPSPHRIASDCAVRGCGGCAYRGITYAHERDLKQQSVRQAFRRAGVAAEVLPVLCTGSTAAYRNKAQYPVTERDGHVRMGFFAPRSHRVVPAETCLLQPPVFQKLLAVIAQHMERNAIPAYREETHTGLVRHVYLRRGEVSGEVLVTLVVNGDAIAKPEDLVRDLRVACPEVVGVLLNINRARTNVINGPDYRTLWGRDYILDRLCGVELKIPAPAFYQVHHDAAELLYRKAADLAALSGRELVLDLYCGVGSIGLSLAHRAARVIGVEVVPEAVACAWENAARNRITNASFYLGDAAQTARLLSGAEAAVGGTLTPDVVVLDPPRKGCAPVLLEWLADEKKVPSIVYISCNPETLARDAALLCTHGYTIGPVQPVDLFPRTGHVEAVCLLKREVL